MLRSTMAKPPLFVALAFVALFSASFILSGCLESEGSGRLEEQAEAAMQKLEEDMGPGGEVKRLSGEFGKEGEVMDMEIEFGSNDTLRIVADGGISRDEVTCTENGTYMTIYEERYVARPDRGLCGSGFHRGPESQGEESRSPRVVRVEEQDDGSLVAELDTEGEGPTPRMAIVIRHGRVVEMTFDDDGEALGAFKVEYGERRPIESPEAETRIPATVHWDAVFDEGVYEATIQETDGDLPLGEFAVQVRGHDDEVLASFPLGSAGTQTMDGFEFEYHGSEEGLLANGDTFTIQSDDWEGEYDYKVVMFDEWAGVTTDENPVPALGVLPVVLTLVGILGIRSRARRDA